MALVVRPLWKRIIISVVSLTAVYYVARFVSHQRQEAELARIHAKEEAEKERIVSFADFMGMGKTTLPVVILEKRDGYLKIRAPNGNVFEYSGAYTILQ